MADTRSGAKLRQLLVFLIVCALFVEISSAKGKGKNKDKKNIRDYNDADMEKLFMEWEEAEGEHDPDDLMEHERPSPNIDFSQIDPRNPESAMKLTKKGKTLMMFVSVSGNPTKEETDKITNIWQSQLFNAQYQLDRYPVSDDRVIFLLKDGSKAWEIKDFLINQERCQEVSIESQVYHGRGSGKTVDGTGTFRAEDGQADKAKTAEPTKPKTKKDAKSDRTKTKSQKKTETERKPPKKTSTKTTKTPKDDKKVKPKNMKNEL